MSSAWERVCKGPAKKRSNIGEMRRTKSVVAAASPRWYPSINSCSNSFSASSARETAPVLAVEGLDTKELGSVSAALATPYGFARSRREVTGEQRIIFYRVLAAGPRKKFAFRRIVWGPCCVIRTCNGLDRQC